MPKFQLKDGTTVTTYYDHVNFEVPSIHIADFLALAFELSEWYGKPIEGPETEYATSEDRSIDSTSQT